MLARASLSLWHPLRVPARAPLQRSLHNSPTSVSTAFRLTSRQQVWLQRIVADNLVSRLTRVVDLLDSIRPYIDWQTSIEYLKDPPAEYAAKVQVCCLDTLDNRKGLTIGTNRVRTTFGPTSNVSTILRSADHTTANMHSASTYTVASK